MKAYISYFKLKFISGLQYRSAAIAGMLTQFFFGIIYIMVFVAFYESGSKGNVMTLNEVITYLWLNQAFFGIVNQRYKDTDILKLIRTGYPLGNRFLYHHKILMNIRLVQVHYLAGTLEHQELQEQHHHPFRLRAEHC